MQTRLLEELDESRTRSLVRRNFSYLQKILDGNEEVESERARLYARGGQAREALLYTMITHPYSDNQLEWVVDELQVREGTHWSSVALLTTWTLVRAFLSH